VEGRLNFSQWTNPEGQKRSKLEVVVENFQFLGGRGEGGGQGAATGTSAESGWSDESPPPAGDDDIPF
jgi:single-strand DNA-binding protein